LSIIILDVKERRIKRLLIYSLLSSAISQIVTLKKAVFTIQSS